MAPLDQWLNNFSPVWLNYYGAGKKSNFELSLPKRMASSISLLSNASIDSSFIASSPLSASIIDSFQYSALSSPSQAYNSTNPMQTDSTESLLSSLSAASSHLTMSSGVNGGDGDVRSFVNFTTTMESTSDATLTNSTDVDDYNKYILPLAQQIILSAVFGIMIFIAAGGNIIVIWIVTAHKRMRTVTNYFLVNLSIADIMVSTLNVIFNFIYMLNADWPFGALFCKVANFIAILSVAASVFTLMAISIDRYIAIVHPLKPRMSRTMTIFIILVIWSVSCLLSLPNYIFSTTLVETFKNGDSRVICFLDWYDGPSTKSRVEYIYNVVILLLTYVLPISMMSFTYFRIGRELWGSKMIGEMNPKQLKSIESKQKIVKMMIIVVVIFMVCWAPYHIYFLLAHHYPQIVDSEYAQHTYLVIYWLAMSNSMYNPMVYCWLNSRFREGFKSIFSCTCLRRTNPKSTRTHHPAARYSCGSEALTVRLNGNGNITLQATSITETTPTTIGATSLGTGPLQLKTTSSSSYSREML